MANITELKDTDRLIDSPSVINNNFKALNDEVGNKANADNVYTKKEIEDTYVTKSALTNAQNTGILDYIGNNLDVLNAGFTELSEELADVYTKTEADNKLALKANSADVYNKTQVDSALSGKVSKSGDNLSGNLNYYIDDGELWITGATSRGKGAELVLKGININDGEKGSAFLGACNDAGQYTWLGVHPNGSTIAPTPATNDNSTKIATTAWVRNNIGSLVSKTFDIAGMSSFTLTSEKPYIVIIKITENIIAGAMYLVGSYATVRTQHISVLSGSQYIEVQSIGEAPNTCKSKFIINHPNSSLVWVLGLTDVDFSME